MKILRKYYDSLQIHPLTLFQILGQRNYEQEGRILKPYMLVSR